jgi:hypothetical protein
LAQALTNIRDVLGDRYQLQGELGSGGQGTVFRALDLRLDRTVAVKFLRPEVAPLLGPERFQREIAIAAPPERVWEVLTQAEHLGAWFGDAGAAPRPEWLRPSPCSPARRSRSQSRCGQGASPSGRAAPTTM